MVKEIFVITNKHVQKKLQNNQLTPSSEPKKPGQPEPKKPGNQSRAEAKS